MKLLIASDLHGSVYYVDLLMKRVAVEQPDLILLLGDYLNHGPRNPLPVDYNPQGVAKLLNQFQERIIGVRGNCDSEVDQLLLAFPMMGDYAQVVVDNFYFFLSHGHRNHLSNNRPNTILLSGHTHIPVLENQNGMIIFNPGSVSLPKEDHPATYGVYHHGQFFIKTMSGEVYKQL